MDEEYLVICRKKTSGVPVPEDDVMAQLEDVLAKTLKKDKGKKSN